MSHTLGLEIFNYRQQAGGSPRVSTSTFSNSTPNTTTAPIISSRQHRMLASLIHCCFISDTRWRLRSCWPTGDWNAGRCLSRWRQVGAGGHAATSSPAPRQELGHRRPFFAHHHVWGGGLLLLLSGRKGRVARLSVRPRCHAVKGPQHDEAFRRAVLPDQPAVPQPRGDEGEGRDCGDAPPGLPGAGACERQRRAKFGQPLHQL